MYILKIITRTQSFKIDNKEAYFWIGVFIFILGLIFDISIVKWLGFRVFIDYNVINFGTIIGKNINIKNSVIFGNKEYTEEEKTK